MNFLEQLLTYSGSEVVLKSLNVLPPTIFEKLMGSPQFRGIDYIQKSSKAGLPMVVPVIAVYANGLKIKTGSDDEIWKQFDKLQRFYENDLIGKKLPLDFQLYSSSYLSNNAPWQRNSDDEPNKIELESVVEKRIFSKNGMGQPYDKVNFIITHQIDLFGNITSVNLSYDLKKNSVSQSGRDRQSGSFNVSQLLEFPEELATGPKQKPMVEIKVRANLSGQLGYGYIQSGEKLVSARELLVVPPVTPEAIDFERTMQNLVGLMLSAKPAEEVIASLVDFKYLEPK